MTFFTTFTPGKISWELTTIANGGKGGDSNWMKHLDLIEASLKKLKAARIDGIRLTIFPNELTDDAKKFDWKPLETMLDLCQKYKVEVEWCIGPFQYPNYPGIYFPQPLLKDVFNNTRSLDTTPALRDFGDMFLEKQLMRYGDDERIRGFHFANEWPDQQHVQGKESVKTGVSHAYMLHAAKYIKEHTDKPISFNTNIDASDKRKLSNTFGELLDILEERARLGFDVYPSQETWRKAFWQKLKRLFEPYQKSYQWCDNRFPLCELFFCEVEAQPWGNGWSWYRIINAAENPQEKVIQYSTHSLPQTMKKYIHPTGTKEVSLWGAEFWLSADAMGIKWPLEQIKQMTKSH
jgi:hypothetical protein